MHLLRARFAGDIVAEFLPPRRHPTLRSGLWRASSKPSNKVIVFCDGLPGMPGNKVAQEYVSKKGYWSFFPRYRGSWESGGELLDHDPYEDICDVIEGLSNPIIDLWSEQEYRIEDPEIYVIGTSFGGPSAIFASAHPKVKRAVAVSPVVDWRLEQESEAEPMDWLGLATKRAFGEGYRYTQENWDRLARGELYNPVDACEKIDPSKLMIVHAEDDDVVLYPPVATFAKEIGCTWISLKRGGHFGSRIVTKRGVGKTILKFCR